MPRWELCKFSVYLNAHWWLMTMMSQLMFPSDRSTNKIHHWSAHFAFFLRTLLAHDIQATSHVRTAGCIYLHTNGMTHVHSWDEQTWVKIQIFLLPPEMYILRMYGIRTFCTFLVCTKELFLVCTNMYRTSKCWFKLHLYLYYVTFRLIPFSLAL